jgi:hypothetical protein
MPGLSFARCLVGCSWVRVGAQGLREFLLQRPSKRLTAVEGPAQACCYDTRRCAAILPTTDYHAQDSRYCSPGDIPSHPSPGWPRLPLHPIRPRPLKHCPTSNPRPRPIRIPYTRAFLAYNVYASSRTKADRRPSRYIPRSLASHRSLEARILRIPYPASVALRRMTTAYHHMPTSAASAQWEKLLHGR